MDWVKCNLLTLLSAALTVAISVLLALPVEAAFLVWFTAFVLDASYTFMNRRYVMKYELNVMVRRSATGRGLVTAFIKVLCIEYAVIFMLSLLLISLDSSSSGQTGLAVSFMLFAVIHASAFLRSYRFITKKEKERMNEERKKKNE